MKKISSLFLKKIQEKWKKNPARHTPALRVTPLERGTFSIVEMEKAGCVTMRIAATWTSI